MSIPMERFSTLDLTKSIRMRVDSRSPKDDYEMIMVHHHPLQNPNIHYGMGNYLLYMTPGVCQQPASTTAAR